MRRVERREGGWYVVEDEPGIDGYSTTSAVTERRRIPIEKSAPRERAVFVARQMGMLDDKEER